MSDGPDHQMFSDNSSSDRCQIFSQKSRNYLGIQWVLVYRDDWVQKFQKIPIIEFSGSLINLINLIYRDFPGKIPVFEFFWENPDIRG